VLSGHTNIINSVAFSPDDTRVLTASLDHTAALWDVTSGEAILALNGHDSWVSDAAFSKDGTQVVTASADDTARLWIMPAHCQPLIVAAHADELRDPTPDERAQYFLTGPAPGGGTLDTFNRWFAPLLPKEGETCQ
jgi:WD40 repeat protein